MPAIIRVGDLEIDQGLDFQHRSWTVQRIGWIVMPLIVLAALLKQRVPTLDNWLEGVPLVIVEEGKPMKDRMKKVQVGEEDVLSAARELQGLERMEQIKYAVLERHGAITIVPK